jgi:hypothetical protein
MSRNSCIIIIAAFVLGACDPQNEPGTPGSPDAGKTVDAAPATKPAAGAANTVAASPAAPGAVHNLSSCIGTCEDPKTSATDRATCRLNCENSYGFKPGVAAGGPGDPVGDAVSCLGRCHIQGGASLDTCTAGCKAVAGAAPVAPAPASLDELSTCLGTCYADKQALPTNRATCELTCAQAARVAGPAQPPASH